MSALCGEGPASDRGFTAVMHAVPASIARWAVIGGQNRRVSGREKDVPAAILGERLISRIFSQNEGRGVWEMPSPRLGWNRRAARVSALCGEMSVSDRGFTAVMRAVPAISARWAVIGRRNRRVSGRGKDNAAAIWGERLLWWIFSQNEGRGVWEISSPRRGWNRRAARVSALCGEGPASDRGCIAEMRAVPAINARWAAIGRRNRRACGRGKDNAAAGSA